MARSKPAPDDEPQTIELTADQFARLASPPAVQEPGGEDDIAAILAHLGNDTAAHVRLYRENKGGRDAFIQKFSPQEWIDFDIDGVQENYGGGNYRVRVYDEKSKVRGNRGFSVEAPPRANGAAAPPAPAVDIATVVTQAVTAALGAVMERIAPALQAVAHQPSRSDMLAELLQMKQIFAPAVGAVAAPLDPLDMLQKVLAITKDLAPRDGETTVADVFLNLAKEFAPIIGDNIKRAQQAAPVPGAAPPAPQRAISAGPALPPANSPAPQPAEDEAMVSSLKWSIGFLVAQAEADHEPGPYAEMVLDNLPAEMLDKSLTMSDEQLLVMLAHYDPRVSAHAEWFKRLRGEMRDLLTPEPESGTNTLPGGDKTD